MVDNTYRNELAVMMPQDLIDRIFAGFTAEQFTEIFGIDPNNGSFTDLFHIGLECQARLRYMWADAMIKIGAQR